MWYRANRKGYFCGTYAKHGNKACTNLVVEEQRLVEIILSVRRVFDRLDHPDLESEIKKR